MNDINSQHSPINEINLELEEKIPATVQPTNKRLSSLKIVSFLMILSVVCGYAIYSLYVSQESLVQPESIPQQFSDEIVSPSNNPTIITTNVYTTFPNEHFDFITMNVPDGWNIQTKEFGHPNSLNFPSYYSPECDTDRCAGIMLTKDNVKLEMVFNFAFDSAGFVCTNNPNSFTRLDNNWTRINHPTGEGDAYIYKYVYADVDGWEQPFNYEAGDISNGDWYFPDLSMDVSSESTFAYCTLQEPLILSKRVKQDYDRQNAVRSEREHLEVPRVIATSPRIFSVDGKLISETNLIEIDQIITDLKYHK